MKRTAAVPTPPVLRSQAQVFKALGHPVRLRMVQALADGERCVCELNALADVDLSTISRHLGALKAAGVLTDEKRGNKVFYRLALPCVISMMRCLETPAGATRCCG